MNQALKFDKRRHRVKQCPCGRNNRDGKFAPFTGYEDKGHCHSCGKTFFPATDGQQNGLRQLPWKPAHSKDLIKAEPCKYSTVPPHYVEASMQGCEANDFVTFLFSRFSRENVERVIGQYRLGSSNRIKGSVVFWYIDKDEQVRSGKVMRYNQYTGKRVKDGKGNILWVHTLEGWKDFRYCPCLYGEHLLRIDRNKPVAIVESEKSAIIAALCMPQYLWMATGGMQNFRGSTLQVLSHRKVVAFPDLGACDRWKDITEELPKVRNIMVSDYLERVATQEEKDQKLDIADYLLRQTKVQNAGY
jgi:hypothetical protein